MDSGIHVDQYEKYVNKCLEFFNCDATIDIYERGKRITIKNKTKLIGLIGETQNAAYYLGHNHISLLRQKSVVETIVSLCHEIVHYIQEKEGRFLQVDDGFVFDNEFYSYEFPYIQRPWEIEAFANQEKYFQLFIDNLSKDEITELINDLKRN